LPVGHLGESGESGDIPVIVEGKLAIIGLPLSLGVGIGPLVRDDAATRPGDDLHSGNLPFRCVPVQGIKVGDSAGGVFDAVQGVEAAELSFFEKPYKSL
jgi:hypothetical protein